MDSTDGLAFQDRADFRFVKMHMHVLETLTYPAYSQSVRKTLLQDSNMVEMGDPGLPDGSGFVI